jgi:ketosteroid isomerase-like protein
VHLIKDGRWAGVDFYEPGDRQPMIARYAELGGGMSKLGNSSVERAFAEFAKRYAARDLEPQSDLITDDFQWSDHRQLAWEPLRGRDAVTALVGSSWEGTTDIRIEVDEVLACDGRVLAVRCRWVGHGSRAGAFELPAGQVVVAEGERYKSLDQYDGEDRDAMLARYAELGGRQSVLGDRPPERFLAEAQHMLDRREYGRLRSLLVDNWRSIDHRAMGWDDLHGPRAWEASTRSFYEASPTARVEVLEVLACDDRVIALRQAWRARGVKAGEMEVVAGAVYLIEDGRWVSVDYYEPTDRQAMITRYAELGGGAGPLGDRPPERFFKRWIPPAAAGDVEAVAGLVAEDFVRVDHRSLGWEPLRGREANVALWRSAYEAGDVRMEAEEVLACDDRVIAWRFSWCGLGSENQSEWAVSVGQVNVIEDGLWRSCDQYNPDDRDAMLARFAELSRPRGAGGSDRPPQRFWTEFARRWATGEPAALADLIAEDIVQVDRRSLALWSEVRGRADMSTFLASTLGRVLHPRWETREVLACDDEVIAMLVRASGTGEHGIEYTYEAGHVAVVQDGLCTRTEIFDPDDREAMLARFRELSGADESVPRVLRLADEQILRWNDQDEEAVVALYAENAAVIDHRGLGSAPLHGRKAIRKLHTATFEVVRDPRQEVVEVLACDENVAAYKARLRGKSPDAAGGEGELWLLVVDTVQDGEIVRVDLYEPEDRVAAIARYVEAGGGLGKLGDTASEQLFAEYARRYARRDYDAVLELMSEDYVQVDHRTLGWSEIGKEQNAAEIRSVWAGTTDIRPEVDEVLQADERALLCTCTYRGSADATVGGGQFEYQVGFLLVSDGERSTRVEWFDPHDRDTMLARYRELSRDLAEAARLGKEIIARWNRHDIDHAMELFAEDIEFIDHRSLGAEALHGQAAVRELHKAAFEVMPDNVQEVDEILACDDRVIAFRLRFRGTSPDAAGGEFEVLLGGVDVFEDGKLARVELFEPDDTAGILRRFAELGGASR